MRAAARGGPAGRWGPASGGSGPARQPFTGPSRAAQLNLPTSCLETAALNAGPTATPAGPSRIVLELTERDQVAGYDRLRAVLAPYRARGIAIAVDDTGAGYASLRHLTELGPEFVKLDARLVTGLTGDRGRQALVRAMTTFAAEIGSVLVAEGVERLELAVVPRRAPASDYRACGARWSWGAGRSVGVCSPLTNRPKMYSPVRP